MTALDPMATEWDVAEISRPELLGTTLLVVHRELVIGRAAVGRALTVTEAIDAIARALVDATNDGLFSCGHVTITEIREVNPRHIHVTAGTRTRAVLTFDVRRRA